MRTATQCSSGAQTDAGEVVEGLLGGDEAGVADRREAPVRHVLQTQVIPGVELVPGDLEDTEALRSLLPDYVIEMWFEKIYD